MTEQVFIVPYDKTIDIPHGFNKQKHCPIWNKYNDIGIYVDKDVAENTPAMQQIIPYVILRSDKGNYYAAILQKEDNKIISIGFGNHIEPCDGTTQPLFKGTVRTLFEEISLEQYNKLTYVGTVRDMGDDNKHLGYVFLIQDIEEDSISLQNKTDTYYGEWLSLGDLINSYSKMTCWSKHIVNYLVGNTI